MHSFMLPFTRLLIPLLLICNLSCKQYNQNTYAIKDFRDSIQPFLTTIVSKGILTSYGDALENTVNDKEILELCYSEHPLLRAFAFQEIQERNFYNCNEILMQHLDDTAQIAFDMGEFGIGRSAVADHFLQRATWKTQDEKDKSIELVLTKHHYLQSAFRILRKIEPQEKYYAIIKNMALRPRILSDEGYELAFDDIEYALYGLARFKKKEDISLIKDKMLNKSWELSNISFRLMKEYPDTAYMEVLSEYHSRKFYRFSGNRRGGFTGYYTDRADPEDFIQALVAQQNERSARLLDTMLLYLPRATRMPDHENILKKLMNEIWGHPCPAYAAIRNKIKSKVENSSKWALEIPTDEEVILKPKENEIIRW